MLWDLFPYVAAFYLLDALVRVAPSEVVLLEGRPGRFWLEGPGWRTASLLPTAEVFVATGLSIMPTPEGLYVSTSAGRLRADPLRPDSGTFVAFKEMARVVPVGRTVREGDRVLVRTASERDAKESARFLESLRRLPRAMRQREIEEHLRATLDVERARKIRERQRPLLPFIHAASSVLWLTTFVVWPLSTATDAAFALPWEWAVFAALGVHLTAVALCIGMLRRCGQGWAECLRVGGAMLLYPVSSLHAAAVVGRRLYAAFDPVAVAAAVMEPDDCRTFLRRVVYITRCEIGRGEAPGARSHYWVARQSALQAAIDSMGDLAGGLFDTPARDDPAATSYCPVCVSEYLDGADRCRDCDAGTVPFEVGSRDGAVMGAQPG